MVSLYVLTRSLLHLNNSSSELLKLVLLCYCATVLLMLLMLLMLLVLLVLTSAFLCYYEVML